MARCNRSAVLQAIEQYRQQLAELETLVELQSWPALQQRLEHCQALRPEFL
jgi:arogenate dehydrogenase (NADP+)